MILTQNLMNSKVQLIKKMEIEKINKQTTGNKPIIKFPHPPRRSPTACEAAPCPNKAQAFP